jgi:hypothetical protein
MMLGCIVKCVNKIYEQGDYNKLLATFIDPLSNYIQ